MNESNAAGDASEAGSSNAAWSTSQDWVLLLTTVGSEADAQRIADALVESSLAACVSLVPGLRSTYRWQGRIESADEVQLLVKTKRDLQQDVAQRILALHPYDLPELLSVPVSAGSKRYLDWLAQQVT